MKMKKDRKWRVVKSEKPDGQVRFITQCTLSNREWCEFTTHHTTLEEAKSVIEKEMSRHDAIETVVYEEE